MSNALVKLEFDKEQMAVIETQLFPSGTSKAEQQYCLSVARELCLNPITKEIFFVKRRQKIDDKWVTKVEPMVGRDGFLSIAHRSKQFAGIETTAGIREVPQLEGGQWGFKNQLVTECIVWRKDSPKPFTVQVAYNEYCQRNSEGNPTKFWAEKPETMLKKVAESQALRKAFNIHGVYCPEELGAGFELASGDIVIQAIEEERPGNETDKSHLSVVKPPQAETQATKTPKHQKSSTATTSQSAPINEEVQTSPPSPGQVIDEAALLVIELLDGKHIPYDIAINGLDGIISAKSFNEKELLKSSGFRWSADQKRWIYKFRNEPF
ncbi:phage recombination protein Bet [Pelobacter propionicus]|uniref:Phage recombination protein Bet n=1 Tax=Pelobacter propionicus (strain DSM 2379 / NBRC 103807 / OttBd1) TaxID=338966 RepID=A1AQ73_PELPD|nr:phage recombination protein Bet [Pelobacter propionicus]ABK99493.1 phage recombination protein Bet [Pelobacter propionicus DSM 2379]